MLPASATAWYLLSSASPSPISIQATSRPASGGQLHHHGSDVSARGVIPGAGCLLGVVREPFDAALMVLEPSDATTWPNSGQGKALIPRDAVQAPRVSPRPCWMSLGLARAARIGVGAP